ncbi:MAG: hypothetical protein KYX62_18710 [Pseudomonadota bacterium]|nr:hypothetical protein [Pseudomonadota bacterium]
MALAGSLFLLIMSGLLLWSSRPGRSWSGIAAARFAAGLIMLLYALVSLPLIQPGYRITLLLQQLSLYAALPLLSATLLIHALGYRWSRLIWGRILLALCVVFELMRRAGELQLLIWIALGAAIAAALLSFTANRSKAASAITIWAAAGFWFSATQLQHGDICYWLAVTIIPPLYLSRAGNR